MRESEKNLVCQMPGEVDRAFAAAGWTEVEALTREGSEVVVATLWVGAADTRDTCR